MVRQSMLGKFEFYNDQPINCDCGCRVEPEHDVEIHRFKVTTKDGITKNITMTTCADEENACESNVFFHVLNAYPVVEYKGYENLHIYSAREERAIIEDMRYEDSRC